MVREGDAGSHDSKGGADVSDVYRVMAEMETKTLLGELRDPGGPDDGEINHMDCKVS